MTVSTDELQQAIARIGRPVGARELAAELRRTTGRDIRKRNINPLLYGSAAFERVAGTPPHWRLATAINRPTTVHRPERGVEGRAAPPGEAIAPGAPLPPVELSPPVVRPPITSSEQATRPPTRQQPVRAVRPTPTISPTEQASPQAAAWPLATPQPYAWQLRAYDWWLRRNRCGIVEAVTGTGKTLVGLAALADALQRSERVLLLVPSIVLQLQWRDRIAASLPLARVGLLGDGSDDSTDESRRVLVAVVHSASVRATRLANRYQLVIADECHRYGAESFRLALLDCAPARLGLTATFERADDGVEAVLRPYFGDSFSYSYDEATADGVLASFVVADVGTRLSPPERAKFDEADRLCRRARSKLIQDHGFPTDPGLFMQRANEAAKTMFGWFGAGKLAKQYVKSFRDRQDALSESRERIVVLDYLASSIVQSGRALLFTESIDAAMNALTRLQGLGVSAGAYHSGVGKAERAKTLELFATGRLQALVAVRALDEGVDVPDVDLGVILSASRTKRQMIQRLGRVVRRKSDGRYARLVIVYAENTYEDPAQGSHEAFREAIVDAADDMRRFQPDDVGQVGAYLASFFGPRSGDDSGTGAGSDRGDFGGSTVPAPPRDQPSKVVGKIASSSPPIVSTPASSGLDSIQASDSRASTSTSMPPRQAEDLAADVAPQIAFDGFNGRLVLGRKSFDLNAELGAHQSGTFVHYRFRGEVVASLNLAGGDKRLTIRLGPAHRTLDLVNPSLEVQQAAISLAIAVRDDLEARSAAQTRLRESRRSSAGGARTSGRSAHR